HIVFPTSGMLQNLWGRPPGLRGTPSSRSPPAESRPCTRRWPTRASAADEGVRPTIYADVRLWENYVALPLRSRLVALPYGRGSLRSLTAAVRCAPLRSRFGVRVKFERRENWT